MADHGRTGTALGRFFLEAELGQGAAGVVYRARDTMLGSTVALKVIHPELLGDSEVKERFKREILLSRRAQHKGVCRIYDLHEIEQHGEVVLALAMELLDGETLATEIHEAGLLSPKRTLEVLEALVPPLTAAHEAGVVHRDLKPGNVMVTRTGEVKLLDFGMATADDVMRVTRPGNTVGSLRFIAPEVWEGEPATALSDLYALGVLLFACLSGRLPYDAKSPGEMFNALKKPPPSLVGDIEGVTPAMDAVVHKAMARRPADRHKSARALLEEFRRAVEGEQTLRVRQTGLFSGNVKDTQPVPDTSLQPLPLVPFLLLCAALLLGAVVLAVALRSWRSAPASVDAPDSPAHLARWQEGAPAEDSEDGTAPQEPAAVEPAAEPPVEPTTARAEPVNPGRGGERRPAGAGGISGAGSNSAEHAQLMAALKKRAVALADLPAAEALEQRARKLEGQGDRKGAALALQQARAEVEKAAIDRGFIMSKQKRLTRVLDNASPKVRDKVRPLEADIARAFAARDYTLANQLINRAFAAAR